MVPDSISMDANEEICAHGLQCVNKKTNLVRNGLKTAHVRI